MSVLPGESSEPQAPELRESTRNLLRGRILDLIGPTYILDSNYIFIDWNPTFEELFAKPLGLMRNQHVETFVRKLRNADAVIDRSILTFQDDALPQTDLETLECDTESFGVIKF